ncbi:MAG: hypothetical protein JSV61_14260 [Anaerolineales bacterium]|nr:MAG: hypothetical protein JSV61_14260 [Anaerolineales bacterium]
MAVVQTPKTKYLLRMICTLAWLIVQLLHVVVPAKAAKGLPGSSEFGFGARLDMWGLETELAIKAATAIGLDWIAVDFDWSHHWKQEDSPLELERLDQVIQQAGTYGLSIMVSVTNPPEWARTAEGPDLERTLSLLTLLAERYSAYQLAFELFPAPNTVGGWSAPPNPQAYSELLRQAYQMVNNIEPSIALVAGGLLPSHPQAHPGDMDDLEFLSALYQAGASSFMPVVGLRLAPLTGDALTPAGQAELRVLRHYEAIRQVMLAHGHAHGLVWVTGYQWPESLSGQSAPNPSEQIRWLNQALHMMKSQLYLGVAFYDRLNPPADFTRTAWSGESLIIKQDNDVFIHPAVKALGRIITMVETGQNTSFQLFLYKKFTLGPEKSLLKNHYP